MKSPQMKARELLKTRSWESAERYCEDRYEKAQSEERAVYWERVRDAIANEINGIEVLR